MKLFAQHGYGEGEKILNGLKANLIDGIVFSPRDVSPNNLELKLNDYRSQFPEKEYVMDPQYYTCVLGTHPNLNIGKLSEYQDYYFNFQTKNRLEIEKNVIEILESSINFQHNISTSSIIAPNIIIPRSFDSREAVIAKNFIRLATNSYRKKENKKPLYCSLVISSDAIRNIQDLQEFLSDITLIDEPPDGYYLIISHGSSDARAEIFNSDTISAWMLINHSLKINEYKIINGYSDIISPFLSSVGADACCTGWWSNLRNFSMERFTPTSAGGRLPIQRYLSMGLLNRLTFYEYDTLKDRIIGIKNNLDNDSIFDNGEPERAREVLQSWEGIKTLISLFSTPQIKDNITNLNMHIENALNLYSNINSILPSLDTKSNSDHLEPLLFALSRFSQITEI